MAKILCGTSYVTDDEPCLGLFEICEQSPGSRGFHRYQILYVMRGDRPAQFRIDMGSMVKWAGTDQFRIPGGALMEDGCYKVEHTVGELRDIANWLREVDIGFDKREIAQTDRVRVR